MRHGMPEQETINDGLDAHGARADVRGCDQRLALPRAEGRSAHDVLLCIGTGKTVSDTNRMRFYSDQFYVKSAEEMLELWSDLPEASKTP